MKQKQALRLALLVCLIAAGLLWSNGLTGRAQGRGERRREIFQGRDVVENEVLVRFRDGAGRAAAAQEVDADEDRPVGGGAWRKIHSRSRNVQAIIAALQQRGDVTDVEPNYIVHSTAVPNDPLWGALWGLPRIGAPAAWDVTTGSNANVIGVLDTGADWTHPDLAANIWSAPTGFTVNVGGQNIHCPAGSHGFNAIAFSCSPWDDHSHGTHVSGTIGAVGNDGNGVAGVNWTTRIMALKFLNNQGNGSLSDAIDAMEFAMRAKTYFSATHGADVRVFSASWGGGGAASTFVDALNASKAAEILFVAAAGNAASNNDTTPFYPASYADDNVIAVASSDVNDNRSGFSNYGPQSVDLGAPGDNIYSTEPGGGWGWKSGTSMATPQVSGAAMLVLSTCNLNTANLRKALLASVDVVPGMTGLVATNGRLNVGRAISNCTTHPTITLTSPPGGSQYVVPAQIAFAADATSPNGINRVDFYQGASLVGTSTGTPYGSTWTNVPAGNYSLTAVATDGLDLTTTSSPVAVSVATLGSGGRTNVAAASNGGVATASSTYGSGFPAAAVINGDRKGTNWGNGGGWADGTASVYPDWVQVDFNGLQTIDEVDVFTIQDNAGAPTEPTPTQTFSQWGVVDLTVQYWDGSTWQTVPGGQITGNNRVWRTLTFPTLTTPRIRVWVTNALAGTSRLTEVEAYTSTTNPPPVVSLTGPADGATFAAPANIAWTATASDLGGVTKVELYQGATVVSTSSTSPFGGTWSAVGPGSYTLVAVATDNLGATGVSAPVQVTVTGSGGRTNVAAASNGGVATASSTYGSGFPAAAVINGDRKGTNWGNGGGWADGTASVYPDWVQVDFNGLQTIDEVDVFTIQDNAGAPTEPTPTQTFSQWGVVDLTVQYWDGSTWQTVPGGQITGNNRVWRTLTFPTLTTPRIRVWVTNALAGTSRLTEVEAYTSTTNPPPVVSLTGPADGATFAAPANIAWTATASDLGGVTKVELYQGATVVSTSSTSPFGGTWSAVGPGSYTLVAVATDNLGATGVSAPVQVTVTGSGGRTNVAAASNGGVATASSTYGSGFPAAAVINGDRKGTNWGNGGGWADGTASVYPDWVQVDFNGLQTIDEVDVFTIQDNAGAPTEPTPTQTFSQWGVVDLTVQYWDGSTWQTVPGGQITGNNRVWRTLTFPTLTTPRIRVWVTNALAGTSRLTEVEAYTSTTNPPPVVSLTGPADGATFAAPANIAWTATASDLGGVTKVELYQGATVVSTSSTSPFGGTWSAVGPGSYTLVAVATDNLGATGVSAPVQVTVTGSGGRTNVAAASNGGVATASSTYGSGFPAAAVINGDRKGTNWGNGGGWADGTASVYPDWVQVDFNGLQTIDEVDVFTIQDNAGAPTEPTPTQTFSQWGVVDLTVQYWDGSTWQTVPGGQITGNNRVWRTLTFPTLTTPRIRVWVTNALASYSRLAEVEAYTSGSPVLLTTQLHSSGFVHPIAFVQDPTNASVQFVAEQGGRVRVVSNGSLLPADFLDLSSVISTGGERGLLGLVLAPDYVATGRFFANFTNLAGDTVVARFKRSSNPLIADASSRFDLRWGGPSGPAFIAQPFQNHNGGHLAFGPDGFLYVGLGDGGSADDPDHRAQNPGEFLGKMLRIDVNVADTDPRGYQVPATNPFVGTPALPEIWSFGLRNPWRYSFDDPARGGTGGLILADVGQGQWEEVDYEPPNSGGRNYGWRNREGAHNHLTSPPPAFLPLVEPIHEYDHSIGQSVTGGIVYRGALLGTYRGRYFFADFVSGRVWSLALNIDSESGEATASGLVEHTAALGGAALGNVSSFGTDSAGELYIVSYSGGAILKVVAN